MPALFKPYDLENTSHRRFDYDMDVRDYAHATVYPIGGVNMPRDSAAGIFDSTGSHIRAAGLERNWAPILGTPEPLPASQVAFRDEEVILGGYIAHHYGHFLLESLARIWACKPSKLRILWAAGRQFRDWELEILATLGIDPDRHLILRHPTRFARILVPTPGFIIRRNFHMLQRDALAARDCSIGSEKVYLSRSRFVSKIANIADETVVEEILRRAGWRIVHPELLTFREQLDIFASSATIAGIDGSALHTAILCRNPKARLLILRRQDRNANYDTIAKATGLDQRNLLDQIEGVEGDRVAGRITDPLACAELIMASA